MSYNSKLYQFTNCNILRNNKIIVEDLWVRNGKIINPEPVFYDEKASSHVKIDCGGALISPGFIDIQINGGFGVDFSFHPDTEEAVNKVAKGLLAHGVTSFCPTLVTSPQEFYHKILPKIKKRAGNRSGATILGVHVEGPFISEEKKGAHPVECIKELDNGIETLLETYGSLENVKILTLAPEKENAVQVIAELVKHGITVSLGHSMGNLTDGELAVAHGASLITHLFNGMLPFHHRDPGLVGLLTSDRIPKDKLIYFGIISDGIHTHPAALRIAQSTHPRGLILVTDAVSALGLSDGVHHIGQMQVEVKNGSAYIADTNTLCGSITPMNRCIHIFREATACGTVTALEAATLHPAKAIGVEQSKGTLNFGSDADFVFLDNNLDVLATWIAGECVYYNEKLNWPLNIEKRIDSLKPVCNCVDLNLSD